LKEIRPHNFEKWKVKRIKGKVYRNGGGTYSSQFPEKGLIPCYPQRMPKGEIIKPKPVLNKRWKGPK